MKRKLCLFLVPVLVVALPAGASHPASVTCQVGQNHFGLTNGDDTIGNFNTATCIGALGGNDRVGGSDESDNLWGMDGNDSLYGLRGADRLWGGTSRDYLFDGRNPTGAGDIIHGGGGYDTLLHCPDNGSLDVIDNDIESVLTSADYCDQEP